MKWHVRIASLFTSAMLISCGNPPAVRQFEPDPPELQEYITSLRQWRMTAQARDCLRSVASIATGGTILAFPRDSASGEYGRRYQSTSCLPPGADSLATLEYERDSKRRLDSMLTELRALADADQSGFVTDLEAWQLRELFEFGYFVRYLTSSEHASLPAVAAATHLSEGAVLERARKYNAAAVQLPRCLNCDVPVLALE